MTENEVRYKLSDLCVQAGSQTKWSKANNIAQTDVAAFLRGAARPGPKLLAAMGLKRLPFSYQPIEENEDHGAKAEDEPASGGE